MQLSTVVLTNSVLIVDDDIDALKEMSDALQDHGLVVYTASEVDLALELAKEHRPEFVIMDFCLHGCTGTEVVHEVRKFLPETQVIMISAFDDLARLVTAIDYSVIAVLKKPLSIDSICNFISNKIEYKKRQSRTIKN